MNEHMLALKEIELICNQGNDLVSEDLMKSRNGRNVIDDLKEAKLVIQQIAGNMTLGYTYHLRLTKLGRKFLAGMKD